MDAGYEIIDAYFGTTAYAGYYWRAYPFHSCTNGLQLEPKSIVFVHDAVRCSAERHRPGTPLL